MAEGDRLPLGWACALDVLARRRAAADPLDSVVATVCRERHLGPRERRLVGDLVFGWARHAQTVAGIVEQALADEGGAKPRRREMDLAEIALAEKFAGSSVDARVLDCLPASLQAMVEDPSLVFDAARAPVPPWLEKRLRAGLPGSADDVLLALQRPAPFSVAVDPRQATREQVLSALRHAGASAELSLVSASGIRIADRFPLSKLDKPWRAASWPMDDGSQAVAHLVGAGPGERVLDLCAGGGGKCRLLVATGASVVAADVDESRLRRSLPAGAVGVVADGRRAPFSAGAFDRVLVDAPCSGTGTLRRAPDLALRLREDDMDDLVSVQNALLHAALSLVRPGGRVVYATCSLLQEENADVVHAVLATRKDARALPLGGAFGDAAQGMFLPSTHGTDGFFVASITRLG